MIRSGETKARVSDIFAVSTNSELTRLLAESGVEGSAEDELIVEREVTANGKSRAFVGNRPVTTAFLRHLAPVLGDIHGQNEQQNLSVAAAQRNLLDDYAQAAVLRATVTSLFSDWRQAGENWPSSIAMNRRSCVCSTSGAFSAKRSKNCSVLLSSFLREPRLDNPFYTL